MVGGPPRSSTLLFTMGLCRDRPRQTDIISLSLFSGFIFTLEFFGSYHSGILARAESEGISLECFLPSSSVRFRLVWGVSWFHCEWFLWNGRLDKSVLMFGSTVCLQMSLLASKCRWFGAYNCQCCLVWKYLDRCHLPDEISDKDITYPFLLHSISEDSLSPNYSGKYINGFE